MHILIAPNAFKNSLTADQVAEAISEGLRKSKLPATITCFPVGDGGDGTGSLLVEQLKGMRIPVKVQDPFRREIDAQYGFLTAAAFSDHSSLFKRDSSDSPVAIIEMADASGLKLLQNATLDPLRASSVGTGQLIKAALQKGVRRIILCIGGSATVDGGAGMLQSLGVRFLNSQGHELADLPEQLTELADIDLSGLISAIHHCEIIVLCDVNNTLLGSEGAAAVFGPQKGATPEMVIQLEKGLQQFRDVLLQKTGRDMALLKHGGAAGGIAASLSALLNAKLLDGAGHFLDLTAFDDQLATATVVITGEGSIDEQTLQGKAPFAVAVRAKQRNIPVIGIAGKIPLQPSSMMYEYFDVLLPITHEPQSLQHAMANTWQNLHRTGKAIGDLLSVR